jgi:hypothetical protein
MAIDSTFLMFLALCAFGLMIVGFFTQIGLFHVFSAGIWFFLAFTVSEFVMLLITFAALAIFEIFNAIMAGRD